MTSLDSIPVTVVAAEQGDTSSSVVLPLLHEINAMLEALISSGQTNSIDLRRAPLSPQDHDALRDVLGQGEVKAQLDCLGPTRIEETEVSGVWWTTYYSEDSRVIGEFIQVTTCPEILGTPPSELPSGLSLLRARLTRDSQVADPNDIAESLAALGLAPTASFSNDTHPDHKIKRGNGDAK